jgi:hypothetical protein
MLTRESLSHTVEAFAHAQHSIASLPKIFHEYNYNSTSGECRNIAYVALEARVHTILGSNFGVRGNFLDTCEHALLRKWHIGGDSLFEWSADHCKICNSMRQTPCAALDYSNHRHLGIVSPNLHGCKMPAGSNGKVVVLLTQCSCVLTNESAVILTSTISHRIWGQSTRVAYPT